MNPDFYICDVCHARMEKTMRFNIPTDSIMGAAGSSETEYFIMDLCGQCLKDAVKYTVHKSSGYELANAFKKWVENHRK